MDRQFGLEFSDTPAGLAQLGQLGGRDAGHLAVVDRFLPPPDVDRLTADLQIVRELGDGPTGLQQVEDLPAELGWIASRHRSPQGAPSIEDQPNRLHRTRGRSEAPRKRGELMDWRGRSMGED